MMFELKFTEQADSDLTFLEENPHLKKRLKAVRFGNDRTSITKQAYMPGKSAMKMTKL